MWAYMQNPAMFNAEQVGGLPAILDEVKWGLNFILNMQDTDGGEFMCVIPGRRSNSTNLNTPVERHVFVNKGTGVAARALGSFALGYSVFKKIDHSFAQQLLDAAHKGADWIAKNPNTYLPLDIEAGYLDGRFDSRILAAVEMYIALKDDYSTEAQTYKTFVDNSITTGTMNANVVWDSKGAGEDYSSGDQLMIGDIIYALCRYHPYADASTKTKIESSLTTFYNYYKNRRTNPFGWLDDMMKTYFGSCGWMAEVAPKFIMAGKVLNNPEVTTIGMDLIQVNLGMNPFHRTYVYGEGTNMFPDLFRSIISSTGAVLPGIQIYKGDPAYPIDNYRLDNSPPWTTGEACSPYTPGIVFSLAYMDMQTPFVKQTFDLPGRIQAEDYRTGGEGDGYHDSTPGNTGGAYRTNSVDIELTTDAGGGYDVAWIDAGEWLSYDVSLTQTSTYDLTARVASGNSGAKTMAISIDSVSVATISTSTKSGWQSWVNATANDVKLTAGPHVLRISTTTGGFALNYLDVAPAGERVALFATNCGGNVVSGDDGVWYAADKNFTGGTVTSTTSPIANTSDGELYQSARQGDCSYVISGLANGIYAVTLSFSEKKWTAPGKRIFDVVAEGTTIISKLDIFAAAGGKDIAYDVTKQVTVSDDTLTLSFTNATNDESLICAIAVTKLESSTATVPAMLSQQNRILIDAVRFQTRLPGGQSGFVVSLAKQAQVSLIVLDATGREIAQLAGHTLTAGQHTFALGHNLRTSGLYLYKYQAGEFRRNGMFTNVR
jgi:hypothetical protein